MTTMVEKVAIAIRNVNETTVGLTYSELTREMARAAIEALMEPTESMLDAGDAADGYDVYVGVWAAMIQAALKEGQ